MRNEPWPTRPLRQCATWYSGGTPSKGTPEYWNGTIPWISAKSLNDFFVSDSDDKVTDLGAANGTRFVPAQAVLMVVRGMSLKSEFRMGITTRPVTFNQDLKALVAVDDVLPDYLAYAIKAKTPYILSLVGEAGHGTGVLPTDRIQDVEICVPHIDTQRSTVRLIRALDDKIELNRRMNETLEAMARALFKSWFVDFDPVRAKMAGRAPAFMDAATAALFPASFDGNIPTSWKGLPLDKAAHFLNGLALQKFPAIAGEPFLPVLKIAQLRAAALDCADRASREIPRQYQVENGDLIFSWSGSLLVRLWAGGSAALNQHLFKVTSTRFPRWFVHQWLLEHLPNFQSIAADKATTMGHIQRHHLTNALVTAPSDDLLRALTDVQAPIEAKWLANAAESQTLAALRDLLLPKLLSGEIRIRDAEKQVEAAL